MYKAAAQQYLTTNVCWLNKLFWLLVDLPLCFDNPLPRSVDYCYLGCKYMINRLL